MRRVVRWLVVLGSAGVFFAGVGAGVLGVLQRWNTRESIEVYEAHLEPALEAFLAHQEAVQADSFFSAARQQGDCGVQLNGQFSAHSRSSPRLPLDLPKVPSSLSSSDWFTMPSEFDLGSVDSSWMSRLHTCDHWELVESLPNLDLWAKVRLLQGLQDGRPAEAGRDVWHLAWLVYTTASEESMARAWSLLRLNASARETYQSTGAAVDDWPSMPLPTIGRFATIGSSFGAFGFGRTPIAIMRSAYSEASAPVGLCAALKCLVRTATKLAPFHAAEAAPYLEEVDRLVAAAPAQCSLGPERALWARRGTIPAAEVKQWLLVSLPDNGLARFTVVVFPVKAVWPIALANSTGNLNDLGPTVPVTERAFPRNYWGVYRGVIW